MTVSAGFAISFTSGAANVALNKSGGLRWIGRKTPGDIAEIWRLGGNNIWNIAQPAEEMNDHSYCLPVTADEEGNLYSTKTGQQIPEHINNSGYKRLHASGKWWCSHQLIWKILRGPIPAGYEIDHVNNIPTDNRISNLQLVTKSENLQKAARQPGYVPARYRQAQPVIAVCVEDLEDDHLQFKSIYQASKYLQISSTCISKILKGQRKTTKSKRDGRRYFFYTLEEYDSFPDEEEVSSPPQQVVPKKPESEMNTWEFLDSLF